VNESGGEVKSSVSSGSDGLGPGQLTVHEYTPGFAAQSPSVDSVEYVPPKPYSVAAYSSAPVLVSSFKLMLVLHVSVVWTTNDTFVPSITEAWIAGIVDVTGMTCGSAARAEVGSNIAASAPAINPAVNDLKDGERNRARRPSIMKAQRYRSPK
jgi:hypothetical protein